MKCPDCPKTFFEKHNLQKHLKEKHNNVLTTLVGLEKIPVSNELRADLPTCDICKKSVPRMENLRLHFQAYHNHKRRKKLNCDRCQISFASKSNLDKHLRNKHGHISKVSKRTRSTKKSQELSMQRPLKKPLKERRVKNIEQSECNNEMVGICSTSSWNQSRLTPIDLMDVGLSESKASEAEPTPKPRRVKSSKTGKNERAIDNRLDNKHDEEIESIQTHYKKIWKNVYSCSVKTTIPAYSEQCYCKPEYTCGENCLNRLSLIECSSNCPCGDRCENKTIQKNITPSMERFMTSKKGWGIKTNQSIKSGTFILEYIGEVINSNTFKERMAEEYKNDFHHYCLQIDRDQLIDAHRMGNDCRFVNHSCSPNCQMQRWEVNGEPRMALFSLRKIKQGEEITFNYNFSPFNDAQKCECGENECRGYITGQPIAKKVCFFMIGPFIKKWSLNKMLKSSSLRLQFIK